MAVLNYCCFCVELRLGSLILAYLQLVGTVLLALADLGFALSIDGRENHGYELIGGYLGFIAIHVCFVIFLLVGLHKNKRGNVKAFYIYYAIFIIIYAVSFIASLFSAVDTFTTVITVLELMLKMYFFLVIRSQYYKMDDTNKGVIHRTA